MMQVRNLNVYKDYQEGISEDKIKTSIFLISSSKEQFAENNINKVFDYISSVLYLQRYRQGRKK